MKDRELEKSDIRAIVAEIKTSLLSVLAAGLMLAMIVFTFCGLLIKPVYTSNSSVVVTINGQLSMTSSGITRSNAVAKMLADVVSGGKFAVLLNNELGSENLSGTISAELVEKTNFIKISASASDPLTAYRYLNLLIDCYEELLDRTAPDAMLTVFEKPTLPDAPDKHFSEFAGALIGFVLGAGIMIWYIGYMTVKSGVISSPRELEKTLKLPLISTLSIEKKYGKGQPILIDSICCSPSYAEEIKKLRTRVEADAEKRQAKVVLIMSCFESEGKSTVSSNLSIALAKKKYNVLLCDFDLRNPSVHKIFGVDQASKTQSESNGFGRDVELPVTRLPEHGISILSCERSVLGSTIPEMIGTAKKAIKKFKDQYDFIIIDTSPAMRTPETFDFSEMSDMAVLVVRENNVTKESAEKVIEKLKDYTEVVGCVLNCSRNRITSKLKSMNSYYGLKYRGYGYKYGYGYEKKQK